MKTYNLVKKLLTDHEECRNSDKKLIWTVWYKQGFLELNEARRIFMIGRESFLKATSPETIRRCRQKIQQNYPELRATDRVRKMRKEREENWTGLLF